MENQIKAILHSGCIFNEKEDYILNILNSMTTDDIRSVQEELYYLQKELYKKLNFSQGKKVREFYEANRCGLFATRDDSGNIIRLSYTPGNDLVFVNKRGELLADALKKDGQTEAHYFMLKGTEGLLHTTARSEDVIATLQKNGITAEEAIPAIDCDFSRSVALEKVNALLANGADFSKVDTIISNNDDMALGAIEALKQAGVDTSKMKIVGIDGTQTGLQAILDGDMTATVFQSTSGQAAASLQAAINLALKEKVNTGISYQLEDHTIWVPFEKVTEDNVGDYY